MSEHIFGQSLKPKLVLTGNYKKTKKIEFGEAKIASECFTNRLKKNDFLPKLLRFKWITIDIDILVWYKTLTCQSKQIRWSGSEESFFKDKLGTLYKYIKKIFFLIQANSS